MQAVDIYKKLLLEDRSNLGLNLYIAMCYFKLDYFVLAEETLSVYIAQNPTSVAAVNVKASDAFLLWGSKPALKVLDEFAEVAAGADEDPLTMHNRVAFSNGANAQDVLPKLRNTIPEALLNLVSFTTTAL